ncbi:hypothetical protein [Taklimakanibacter lacteus]|uniref:hypothetical protein n=1 Tax=Taklimakanibacter lacteus TaxID=2268456 RepID=UPI0013C4CA5F
MVKVVCSPTHVRKDGTLRASLIAPSDIERKGVSLIRQTHLGKDEMYRLARAISDTLQDRTVAGVAISTAEKVREIVDADTGAQSLCVFDDPVRNAGDLTNEAHATGIASACISSAEALRIQKLLLKLFERLRSIDEIYA